VQNVDTLEEFPDGHMPFEGDQSSASLPSLQEPVAVVQQFALDEQVGVIELAHAGHLVALQALRPECLY
jgi:hypothetical protein